MKLYLLASGLFCLVANVFCSPFNWLKNKEIENGIEKGNLCNNGKNEGANFLQHGSNRTLIRVRRQPLPESFDLRTIAKYGGYWPRVKDQGESGACYAFSVASFMEVLVKYQMNVQATMSTQLLIDCSQPRTRGSYEDKLKRARTNDGGSAWESLKYIRDKGILEERIYLPNANNKQGECRRPNLSTKSSHKSYKVTPHIFTSSTVEQLRDEVKAWIYAKNRPVVMGFIATPTFVQQRQGISEIYNPTLEDCKNESVEHVVLVIGWDANSWTVMNSYGLNWGSKGGGFGRITQSLICEEIPAAYFGI